MNWEGRGRKRLQSDSSPTL